MQLIHGDCLEIMKDIPDKSVDMIVTDPPYLHVKGGMKSKKFNVGKMEKDSFINTKMNDFDEKQITIFLDEAKRLFKKSFNGYFFCSKLQIPYYLNFALKNKLNFDVLIWDRFKKSMTSCKFYASNIDYIIRIYGVNQGLNNIGEIDNKANYYQKIKKYKQGNQTIHPTEKPTKLIEELMLLSSNKNDIVLDCFMGSGSTGVACKNLHRKFIGMELDNTYFEIAKERINNTEVI